MSDSFLGHALGLVVAGVLAATTSVAARVPAGSAPPPSPAASATTTPAAPSGPATKKRSSLADRVEADLRQGGAGTSPVGPLGHDISWPNCPVGMGIPQRRTLGKPLPPAFSRYVIIGLTNGPGFYPNPCLRTQVAVAHQRHLWTGAYSVISYPLPAQLQQYGAAGPKPSGTPAGRLWNTGWAQARINVASMRAAGLASPVLWLDIEPVPAPFPWSADTTANRTVLEGAMAAYRKAGLRLGVYSTQYLWQSVVGPVAYRLPEWRAAGPTSQQRALALCGENVIQGGPAVLTQWSSTDVDSNVLCPGRPALQVLREYFASS